jgi:hypothetical protein
VLSQRGQQYNDANNNYQN